MYLLHIEHPVPDYGAWKRAFDSDPAGRERAGVVRHRVFRATDDPNHVTIDLEFETAAEAEAMAATLRSLWSKVSVMRDPRARIAELVESVEYRS